jgi:hypothetical protein
MVLGNTKIGTVKYNMIYCRVRLNILHCKHKNIFCMLFFYRVTHHSQKYTIISYVQLFHSKYISRVFGPKRDEVTGERRKLHSEELNDLYSLPNIVRVVKSRRMRWAVRRNGTN